MWWIMRMAQTMSCWHDVPACPFKTGTALHARFNKGLCWRVGRNSTWAPDQQRIYFLHTPHCCFIGQTKSILRFGLHQFDFTHAACYLELQIRSTSLVYVVIDLMCEMPDPVYHFCRYLDPVHRTTLTEGRLTMI